MPEEAGGADAFSQEALKEFVTTSSPPAFPEGAIEPGKTWSPKPNRMPLPIGTLVLERSFTYQGPDPKDPNLVQISMDGKVSLEPAPNVTVKVRSQDGKGTLTFDKQNGRLISSRGNQKTDMVIAFMGQEIDQTTDHELGHDPRAMIGPGTRQTRSLSAWRALHAAVYRRLRKPRASSSC